MDFYACENMSPYNHYIGCFSSWCFYHSNRNVTHTGWDHHMSIRLHEYDGTCQQSQLSWGWGRRIKLQASLSYRANSCIQLKTIYNTLIVRWFVSRSVLTALPIKPLRKSPKDRAGILPPLCPCQCLEKGHKLQVFSIETSFPYHPHLILSPLNKMNDRNS